MEPKMKILIIEDETSEIKKYEDYFATQEDIQFVGATGSLTEGLLLTQKYLPDAVILDLELDEGFGMKYLPQLHKMDLPFEPYVVVTTWTSERRTLRQLKDSGAGYTQIKSKPGYSEYGPQMVTEILREMRPYFKDGIKGKNGSAQYTVSPAEKKRRIISDIQKWLGEININSGKAAHDYLATAIYLTAEYKAEHNMLPVLDKEIYPLVEAEHGLKHGSVEKTMRIGVETAWATTDPEVLAGIYTQYVSPKKGKPELKDFISFFANKVIL